MAIALIFDCGATNLRTIAIDDKGTILASSHQSNQTQQDKQNADYHIWDIDEIWQKLSDCADKTLAQLKSRQIPAEQIVGIGVTTFGVDGAPFDRNGNQLYPIISWKCPRTQPIMQKLADYLDIEQLYQRNGVGLYPFNTLFKLLWLKENQPEVLVNMDKWVFISSMLTHRLTGEWSTDRTMAGTSMMTNLLSHDWDDVILEKLALHKNQFPPMKSAVEKVGVLSPPLCARWGLKSIPVISCGHDTQFAIFGSGAEVNQPVLSSGTWEILMARTQKAPTKFDYFNQGLTTEFDVIENYYNPAVQWIGSGVLEWIGKLLFTDVVNQPNYYETMIQEGEIEPAGCHGIRFNGVFSGDLKTAKGEIIGLSMHSKRGQIYRAALEYMAYQLKNSLDLLQQACDFKAQRILCVGGGSKNSLWNQIRADVLNLPIDIVNVAETTVLGAAMFTFAGVGVYQSPEQAQQAMKPKTQRVEPSNNRHFYQHQLKEKSTC